jgi:hypothetical protein
MILRSPTEMKVGSSQGTIFLQSIGVGNGSRRPRPPNRACGFPAHGSPVGGFLIGMGTLTHELQNGEQPLCREQGLS